MRGHDIYKAALQGKSVLIVEDEEVVTEAIKEVVSPVVSEFESARNGVDGLIKIMDRDFDYILLDVRMPRMSGTELFRHLSVYKPHLLRRVIFITGDTESEETRMFIKKSNCRSLNKPFMIRELLEAMAGSDARTIA
ncbi:MAG: response regulator [Deltaproteobacteria bacterium]|nr:response regulator [Deltaproteobacteria bacterium]